MEYHCCIVYIYREGTLLLFCRILCSMENHCAFKARSLMVLPMDEWTIKTPNPICLFLKIDLLTHFAALCLTDFIDWRYIHSVVYIFDPACELLPPLDEGTILVFCCPSTVPSLWPPPPSPPSQCTVHICRQCVTGGGGGWGDVELCCRPYSAGVLHSVSD